MKKKDNRGSFPRTQEFKDKMSKIKKDKPRGDLLKAKMVRYGYECRVLSKFYNICYRAAIKQHSVLIKNGTFQSVWDSIPEHLKVDVPQPKPVRQKKVPPLTKKQYNDVTYYKIKHPEVKHLKPLQVMELINKERSV